MLNWLPEQASDIAADVDWLNDVITAISLFFTVAIVGAMLYFAIRYRRKSADDYTPRIEGSSFLEMIWTVVPTIVCIFIGYYGVVIYQHFRAAPKNSIEIGVWAQKWKWDFEYSNGKKTVNEFVVPVDQPIKLVMKSRDVIHSFFVPAMRVKRDVLPNAYNYLYFRPIKTGTYQTFCTEYCGREHWNMLAKLHVVSQADYERWLNDKSEEIRLAQMSPAQIGEKLYVEKGCNACHSLTGARLVGPSFLKVFGKKERSTDGKDITVDENYIHESIIEPNKVIVEGYPPNLMPSFQGQLDDKQISALIAFIKAQDGTQTTAVPTVAPAVEDPAALAAMTPAERGKKMFAEKLCGTCHSLDGSKLVGPSMKGAFGRSEKLVGGATQVVDKEYIKESILNPMAKVVDGYPPAMPPYQGQLSDEQISDLIEYIKTVK